MADIELGVVVGSLRKDSFNLKLARNVLTYFPENFKHEFLDISALPLYNQDMDAATPQAVLDFKAKIAAKDAILFVTPEHNRSIPAALKNALDHGTRPWGQNVWNLKPAGVLGTSPGALGTAMAQTHLRNVLRILNMPTFLQPEVFLHWNDALLTEEGAFVERTEKYLRGWVDSFTAFVQEQRKA